MKTMNKASGNHKVELIKRKPTSLPDKMDPNLREPLARVLSVKRMSGTKEEARFRAWLVRRYSKYLQMVDEAGNLWFSIGISRTLFAAHCDTVHHTTGNNNFYVENDIVYSLEECLGADDGAGVAILCYMLSNGIPGTYLFTTGEEIGGVGATYISDNFPDLLSEFDRSICFDRAGTEEIITVQAGTRCASSEFAEALSAAFQDQGLMYVESTHGVYTDNKEWIASIPECVNLSVAYNRQHGSSEHLDLSHLTLLALAAVQIDWESLPTVRTPVEEPKYTFAGYTNYAYDRQYDTLEKQRIGLVEEAIFEWYWGRKLPLTGLLVSRFSKTTGIPESGVSAYIEIHRLKEHQVDGLDLSQMDDEILDDILALVVKQ